MQKKTFWRVILAGQSLVLACAWGQSADDPVFKVGEVRTFRTTDDFTKRVTKEETSEVEAVLPGYVRLKTTGRTLNLATNMMMIANPQEATVRADLSNDFAVRGKTYKYARYSWPLTVGKSWPCSYSTPNLSQTGVLYVLHYNLNCEVVGKERVTTAVGSFDTFKIKRTGTVETEGASGPDGAQATGVIPSVTVLETTEWYAPEVSAGVRANIQLQSQTGIPVMSQTTELVAFKKADGS